MSIGIIYYFKIVHIHQYDPKILAWYPHPLIHLFYQIASIIQPGQWIMICCKFQIFTERQQLFPLFFIPFEQYKYHGKYGKCYDDKRSQRCSYYTDFIHIAPSGRTFKTDHHDYKIFQQGECIRSNHHASGEKYCQSHNSKNQIYNGCVPIAIIQIRELKPGKY